MDMIGGAKILAQRIEARQQELLAQGGHKKPLQQPREDSREQLVTSENAQEGCQDG